MIGVVAAESDLPWVAEFFELFKTPWEPAVPGRRYRAVLSATDHAGSIDADLIVAYGSEVQWPDRKFGIPLAPVNGPVGVSWRGQRVPLYGNCASFTGATSTPDLLLGDVPISYRLDSPTGTIRRLGYDLFHEVRRLLTSGQPASEAATPTLDLHVAVLRQCLRDAGVPFVEIPPRPHGHEFICCLTHDVDFFGIRRHRFDRTLAGFLLRGTVGSLADLLRGRRRLADAARNWWAALTLPLVFLGLKRDFWQPFLDYARADRGHCGTFFLVPFKEVAGRPIDGTPVTHRAVAYGVEEIRAEIEAATVPGRELAVHAIDAWCDTDRGRAERAELTRVTRQEHVGVRVHWLYLSDESPQRLEEAGFAYDSSWGYNSAVGFRAGTLQVFKLAGSKDFLELPLAIMDTAMFYPDRMGLTEREAVDRCGVVIDHARTSGGVVVLNWHDRSLAPERLWSRAYDRLLDRVEQDGAWFATAAEAVQWFRWRRSLQFTPAPEGNRMMLHGAPVPVGLPVARLVLHGSGSTDEQVFAGGSRSVTR